LYWNVLAVVYVVLVVKVVEIPPAELTTESPSRVIALVGREPSFPLGGKRRFSCPV
jgi:hypothetical protein